MKERSIDDLLFYQMCFRLSEENTRRRALPIGKGIIFWKDRLNLVYTGVTTLNEFAI